MFEDYSRDRFRVHTQKIRDLLKILPAFCRDFFRGIESQTSVLTRYAYAVDLKRFFQFLLSEAPQFSVYTEMSQFTVSDLDNVSIRDIEIFMAYISLYIEDEKEFVNNDRAKARKLACLRSFYKYYYKKQLIKTTPPSLVDLPKLHEKPIIRLEANEVSDLLDTADSGKGLSGKQKAYHESTQVRDIAILTLFLGTGIRISELVGINIEDINFISNEFTVTRKGGNKDILVFGGEVRTALLKYIMQREGIAAIPGNESALFLSMQKKRITVRAVENLVKKYASLATPLKKITPHKLRSTYGTMLYKETGDIYLVADVLGHKDVNTTRKHYAAVSEDRRRVAAQVIKLRDEDSTD